MPADPILDPEVFEAACALGRDITDAMADIASASTEQAYYLGRAHGTRIEQWRGSVFQLDLVAASAGWKLGQRLATCGVPAGLDSTAAAVWAAVRFTERATRLDVQNNTRELVPYLSPSRVDAVRKALQVAGHVLARRVGRETVYEVAA